MERGDSADVSLGISSEEFQHYQQQFIQERSEKYALLEKVRRLEQENARLQTEKPLEKDLDRILKDKFQKPLQNLLQRSRKESETDLHQHENTALQRRLLSQEDDFQRQNTLLMQELQQLIIRNEQLEHRLKDRDHPASDSDELVKTLRAELDFYRQAVKSTEEDSSPENDSVRVEYEVKIAALSSEISALQQRIKSEQQKLLQVEKTSAAFAQDLEAKQTSVTLLLAEKEQMQRSCAEKINLVNAEKDSLKTAFRFDLDQIGGENQRLKHDLDEEKMLAKTRIDDVERQMQDLLEQLDVTSHQTKRDQDELLSEHKKQIALLLEQVESGASTNTALQMQNTEQAVSLQALNEERSRLITLEAEHSQLAEKRKATIADLTRHLEGLKAENLVKLEVVRSDWEEKTGALETRLVEANREILRLGEIVGESEKQLVHFAHLQMQYDQLRKSSEEKISELENALTALQGNFEILREQLDSTIVNLTSQLESAKTTAENYETQLVDLTAQLAKITADSALRLHDKDEELRILERKNAGTLRDLQKQLQSEKKRVEKLQSRLNEVLKDNGIKPRSFTEEADFFTEREETGSNASWSFVSPKNDLEVESAPSGMTDLEVKELVGRVAKLQQEKSGLLERVIMLETGSAAMAEDILNKSKIIDRYLQQAPVPGHFQQSKEDAFSLKKMIDHLGKDRTIDAETQRNLRRLLEETLTKNIHLQKNMELLTEELDRVRGGTPPR